MCALTITTGSQYRAKLLSATASRYSQLSASSVVRHLGHIARGHQRFERRIELLQGVHLQCGLLVDLRSNLRRCLAVNPYRRHFLLTGAFGLADVLQVRIVELGEKPR